MKELDDLKDLWRAGAGAGKPINAAMLANRSLSPVAKMKRSLLFDFSLYLITYPAAIWLFMSGDEPFRHLVAGAFVLIAIIAAAYFFSKYRLLMQIGKMTNPVLQTLEDQLTLLEKYLHFYLWVGMALIPLISGLTVALHLYMNFHTLQLYSLITAVGLWFALNCLFALPFYHFNKWYIQKLYGKHLQRLRFNLQELRTGHTVDEVAHETRRRVSD